MKKSGIVWLCIFALTFTTYSLAENIKSKKIMRCSKDCDYTELTWTDQEPRRVLKGLFKDSTRYYCSKPEHWHMIIRFIEWDIKLLALQLVAENKCFYKPQHQEYIATKLISKKGKTTIYKAEWLYNEPEEFYVLHIND